VSQELNQVLEWGVSLAQALDCLHHHNVTLGKVILNHIAIAGKRASWAHLGTALIIPQADHSTAANHVAQDIQGLGSILLHLATGEQRAAHEQLPERVAMILNQALTAPERLTAADLAAALDSALQELRRPVSVMHIVGHRTDVGQERALNEDSLLALDLAAVFRSVSAPVGLFAVADGMGGHEAGDVASRLAVQEIARRACGSVLSTALAGKPLPDVGQWLKTTVRAANQSVHDHREAAGTDMGTTLVMALIVGDVATIANVGDSRAYQLNQTEITQISTDHSLVERLVATGQITREEAANHPQRNIIYRVLGDRPEVEADLFQLRLAPGEALLLCSDGLSGMVSDRRIWQTWQTSISPQDACDLLVEAAIEAGGDDNITVVIVQAAR
jgi:protein phosphatase